MTDRILETFGISVFTSSVFIVMMIVLRALFRGKISMRLQYALWLLVAIKLLVIPVPSVSSPVSFMHLTDPVFTQETTIADNKQVLLTNSKEITFTEKEMQNSNEIIADRSENVKVESKTDVAVVVLVLAGCGSVLMLLYFMVYNLRFAIFLRKRRMNFEGYTAKLPVYLIDGLPSPCLYGRAIYITPWIATEEKLLHVVTHEYCHYRQGDLVWSAIRSLCLICYWWNPLVWVAAYLSKQDCELACDDAALKLLGEKERIPYGETLIGLITVKTKPQDYFSIATTMTGGGRSMKQRIKRIAANQKSIVSVCILLVFLAGIGFVSISTTTEKKEETPVLRENETVVSKEPTEVLAKKELTMEMVIEMFQEGSLATQDYFSFANAEIEDKEEKKSSGILNYYVNFYLSHQGETYRLDVSHNIENDRVEDIYLMRESDVERIILYALNPENSKIGDIEEFLNHKVKMSDMLTIELPDGYTLSEYRADIGVNGGVVIEPEAYPVRKNKLVSGYGDGPLAWRYSGAISVIKHPKDWFVFEDGKLVDKPVNYWNHTGQEKVEVLEGLAMPALLYQVNHDLYTGGEMAILLEQGIELSADEVISEYWYIFFASPEKEEAYYLSLDRNQFTKEQAIEIAKAVRFVK